MPDRPTSDHLLGPDGTFAGLQKAISAVLEVAVRQLEQERLVSRAVLEGLKRGACWCEMGVGNPMVNTHALACLAASALLKRLVSIDTRQPCST